MNGTSHIPEDDLALFALALLPPDDAAATAAHVQHCDLCRAEVARLQGDLVSYAMTAEMHEPPPSARSRLLAAVANEKRTVAPQRAPEPVFTPRRSHALEGGNRSDEPVRTRTGWFGWAGWALAAGLAAGTFWQFRQAQDLRGQVAQQAVALDQAQRPQADAAEVARAQQVLNTLTDPEAMHVALHLPVTPGTEPKPEGHAAYIASKGQLVFVASHLRPIDPNKTYELWVLPSKAGEKPVPAGVFRPDLKGNASVVLPDVPKDVAAKGFGVTIENAGGSAGADTPGGPGRNTGLRLEHAR